MTIDDFMTKYNGKIVGDGQCGNLVRAYWNEVDKTYPPSYENSKDYWSNPVPGYDKVQNPQKGDIAIYDGHLGFPEGHSAIYYDGRVFEQNANPDGSPAHLFPRPTLRLLGYLHKQGEIIMPGVTVVGAPASAGDASTRIDVFARGSDDGLWQKYFTNGTGWSEWVKIGSGVASPPTVAGAYKNDRMDVFFTGIGGDLVHTYFNKNGWTGNESLGQPQK